MGPAKRPSALREFEARCPEVWKRYTDLRDACDMFGSLDAKTRELIKIGMEVARKRHGGLIAHIERAKTSGASTEEITHAILLAVPLLGLPDVLDALATAAEHLR